MAYLDKDKKKQVPSSHQHVKIWGQIYEAQKALKSVK